MRGGVSARGARVRRDARRAEAAGAHAGAERRTRSASSCARTRCAARRSSNAVGLLKEELRRAGSLVLRSRGRSDGPRGRRARRRSRALLRSASRARIEQHPRITIDARHRGRDPERADHPVILATGSAHRRRARGGHRARHRERAPRVLRRDRADRQRRLDRHDARRSRSRATTKARASRRRGYVNCPFDEAQYHAFVAALVAAQKVEPRSFEDVRYFEGCLPVEVMASRGEMTLAFGPMKPVGLDGSAHGQAPFRGRAAPRTRTKPRRAYNLVGFQTRMTWPEQKRVFRMIPGLENAEFLRFGSVHRNTFVERAGAASTSACSSARGRACSSPDRSRGVEGYVESCAGGFVCAICSRSRSRARHAAAEDDRARRHPHAPRARDERRLPAVEHHVGARRSARETRLKKRDRYEAMAERALRDLDAWRAGFAETNRILL